MQPTAAAIEPARIVFEGDTPVSDQFRDSYFMRGQGLAESQAVFVEASHLPERFAGLRPGDLFTLGETGFGTGLNCLLAAECFLKHAVSGPRLHLISAELHPLRRDDLVRSLACWPGLHDISAALLTHYPPPTPGYHRLRLHERVDLTLMLGDATSLWQQSTARVDAWFLDGFAPSKNPDMWQPALLGAIASRSRPGATLATFSAAGAVRRGLAEAGFEVRREPGFGPKRHRLAANFPGQWQAQAIRLGHAAIAGAGLAGATTARALAERGWQVSVYDPAGVAMGASGNLAGVVYSTPSAHLTPQNRFYQQSLSHALRWFGQAGFPGTADQGQMNDVIQYPPDQRAADKLAAALGSGAWPDEILGVTDDGGYRLKNAGYVRPDAWCQYLLDHPMIKLRNAGVLAFEPGAPVSVRLSDRSAVDCDALVLCIAEAARQLPGLTWLPLKLIRGQVSYCAATAASRQWQQAICHAGYLTPALDDLHCIGATYDLHHPDHGIRDEDDQINLDQLRHFLPQHWQQLGGKNIRVVDRRVAVRCQSPDFLPQVGPLPDPTANPHQLLTGIYLNIAHGSRGITHTPLCADLIADQLAELPLPVDTQLCNALNPARFILRQRRRNKDWQPHLRP